MAIRTANTDFKSVDRHKFLKFASEKTTFHWCSESGSDTAQRHGLAASIQLLSLAQAERWLKVGINAISYGGCSVYLVDLREGIAGVHRLASD